MMTKKILFLLTFLLTTIGGGHFALAATETFTLSTVTSGTSYDQTQNGVRLVIDKGSTNSFFHSEGNGYRLFHSGATITITAPEGYAVTELVLTSNNKGNDVDQMEGFTITGNSDWNPFSVGKAASYTWTNGSNTTNPITFTTKNSDKGDVYIASITVTYMKIPFSGTMPYTWIFNYDGSQWPNTTASMLTSTTTYWEEGSVGSQSGYVTKTALSNEALVDGNGTEISETKGLKFTAAAGYIGTALQYELALQGSASVTIPAKAGQKIAVYAWWPAETMTLTNATENTSNAASFTPSAGANTYNFTATADNVTLQVNTSMVFIYSIAVTKNDLTGFALNGNDVYKYNNTDYNSATKVSIGSLTFDYDADYPYLRLKLNMTENIVTGDVATNTGNYFSITESSNTDVIDITNPGIGVWKDPNNNNRVMMAGVHVLKPGTSTLTFSFAGTDSYNATTCTGLLTVNKIAQSIAYPNSSVTISYGGTINNTLNVTSNPSGNTITYASSDTHVATVAADGTVTVHNAGSCTITATLPGSDIYEEASSSYTLAVNATETAPTITMTQNPGTGQATTIANGATVTTTYGNTVTVTGECSVSGPTVKYSSSNTSVATVDANGVVTTVSGGSTTITVYTETYQGYPAALVSYTLTVNATSFTLDFTPTSGTVNVGANITPQMTLPTLMLSDLLTVTASSDNTSVATVPSNLMETEGGNYKYLVVNEGRVNRFLPVITGMAVGTAHITVSFTSNNYISTTATYTVTVTDAGTRNFSWADGESPTYTMYVGDYMKMPEISGNSNGNDSYSKTDAQKYIYYIEADKNKVTWNTEGYYLYEGVPDYGIIDNGTEDNNGTYAAIFYAKGQPSNGIPHTLFLYARAAGTVTIRAYDPQNHDLYCDATLKILERTTIDNAASTYINGMKFPYTWDFTGNFDMTDIVANSHYWERFDDNHYAAGIGFFNVDWADSDADDNYNERSFKPFVAGAATETTAGNYMPLFYGLEMSLQNSAYAPKVDRVRITDYNSSNPDAARLVINGGTTQLRLPKAPTQPSNYRIYMKVKPASKAKIEVGGKKYGVEEYTTGNQLTANTDAIIYFDVTDTSSDDAGSVINLDNVSIYWIATSTEAKTLNYPKTISYGGNNITTGVTYAANTYSYNEDLDIVKSDEANGVTAYYASSFTVDKDAAAGDDTQYAVTMTPANSLEYVKANTGLLLKKEASGSAAQEVSCYMIANPRNIESYSATEKIDGETVKNFLVATGKDGATVTGWGDGYTEFLMAYAYKYYLDLSDPSSAQGDYRFDRDWSFYPAMGSVTVPAQRAFLRIPQSLYVDKNGNIVEMPSGSRSHRSGMAAEAPATKAMLSIIFDDEQYGDDSGETTGINTVSEKNIDSDAWFTLQGVRVNAPAKGGIYIHKGRKVVVK